jgi:hypothetical protein
MYLAGKKEKKEEKNKKFLEATLIFWKVTRFLREVQCWTVVVGNKEKIWKRLANVVMGLLLK